MVVILKTPPAQSVSVPSSSSENIDRDVVDPAVYNVVHLPSCLDAVT